jgi:hypothetical protein
MLFKNNEFYLNKKLNKMSSKDLKVLIKIQESFEILNNLREIPGNEKLNNLWNNLIDIRNNHLDQLKINDQFGLFDSIKSLNVKHNSTQSDSVINNNRIMSYYSEK